MNMVKFSLLFATACLLRLGGSADAGQWNTLDQAHMSNVMDVTVSSNGVDVAYVVAGTAGPAHNLSATGLLMLGRLEREPGADASAPFAVLPFCATASAGCSSPRFSPDATSLAFLSNGALFVTRAGAGSWGTPARVATNGSVLFFDWSPTSNTIAYTTPATVAHDAHTPRVVEDDVIINLITGVPTTTKNVLCTVDINDGQIGAGAVPACFSMPASVGIAPWAVSCWPYDSQFSWSPDGKTIAFSHTNNTFANDWTDVAVSKLDVASGAVDKVAASTSLQPMYNSLGDLAYVQAEASDYVWAQTWHICVLRASAERPDCAAPSATFDNMATLVGWAGDGGTLFYMEQQGTAVKLFGIGYASGKFAQYAEVPFDGLTNGVVGGGFRASSRVTVVNSKGASVFGFSWENFTSPQEAYVGALRKDGTASAAAVSNVNAAAAKHVFPTYEVVKWTSDDGTDVEGILAQPPATARKSAGVLPPLLVFTHCGPAMAVLQTFVGYGSVCARFPLASLVELGYSVLQPNYRGSTGYGPLFRRLDKGDWGGGDFNDVMSGAVALANKGVADIDDISHVGWSYGGYMSALAMGTTMTTHGFRLKAVVTGGTLTDLISHTGTTDISKIIKSWAGGYHWDSPHLRQQMMDNSGMYHVSNASTPTLMFHGIDDPRMPISQSYQLHYALQQRGVPVRFLAFPGSGHIPGDPNQLLRVWDETVSWLQTHAPASVLH